MAGGAQACRNSLTAASREEACEAELAPWREDSLHIHLLASLAADGRTTCWGNRHDPFSPDMTTTNHNIGAHSLPRHPSPSSSLESDYDTDIDSVHADILDNDYCYPAAEHHSPYHPSQPASSLDQRRGKESLRIAEEQQYSDEFWDHFHRKRKKRRPELPALDMDKQRAYDLEHTMGTCNGTHGARAYEIPSHRHSLVDSIRQGWRKNSYHNLHSGWSSPTDSVPPWMQVLSAPRIRRWILISCFSVCLLWLYWRQYGQHAWTEHRTLNNAVNGRINSDLGFFGTNMLPEFLGMTQVMTLNTKYVPGLAGSRRLIFIGDVHGCYEEFAALLSELSFDVSSDHLVLLGDLISKGPSSPGVVDLAIASNASCVRGNHEDRVLLAYRDSQFYHRLTQQSNSNSEGKTIPHPPKPGNPNADEEAKPDGRPEEFTDGEHFTTGDHVDQELARSFTKTQIDYLASCPVILDIGPLRGIGEVRAVHAGLVPGVSIHRQDPMSVMHMRTLDIKAHIPSRDSNGTPWTKIWNKYQNLLPKSRRTTVIYGHDSHRGLRLEKYSKGLDTGCVKGGQLTALVMSTGVNPKPKVVSVNCKDYRPKKFSEGDELGSS